MTDGCGTPLGITDTLMFSLFLIHHHSIQRMNRYGYQPLAVFPLSVFASMAASSSSVMIAPISFPGDSPCVSFSIIEAFF